MAQRFPDKQELIIHELIASYGRAWQVLAFARQQQTAAHEVVLRHWQTQLQTGFDLAAQSGWDTAAPESTVSTVMADMASVVRPPFDRVRQWGLAAALGLPTALGKPLPLQVLYSDEPNQPLSVVGGASLGYWIIRLPLLSWANPLAWSAGSLPLNPSTSPLLKVVSELFYQAGNPMAPLGDTFNQAFGTDTLPTSEVLTLAEQATQGLLFSARPAPVPLQHGTITEQLASVCDTPLSPTDILHVSAAVWVLQASGLHERLKTRPPTLAQVAAQQAQWLHLTLKSWETAQLHQYLQAVQSPVASTMPPVALAVGV